MFVLKNSLSVSTTSLWSLIILLLSLGIILLLLFCLRIWIKGRIVLQNVLWSVNFSLQSFLEYSYTAVLLMLTTLFFMIIVFIPLTELQECTGPHVARASLGRPVNLRVRNNFILWYTCLFIYMILQWRKIIIEKFGISSFSCYWAFYVTSKQGIVLAELVLKGFLSIVWESMSLFEWPNLFHRRQALVTSHEFPLQRGVRTLLWVADVMKPCEERMSLK